MSAAILLSCGIVAVLLLVVYAYLTWHFKYWKKRGLVGPQPRLIFGNFPNAIMGNRPLVYDFDDIYGKYKSHHRAVGVFMTRNPEIIILDPELAQEVMVTDFRKYHDNMANKYVFNKNADKIAARNPFFTTGKQWKERRADGVAGLTANKLSLAYPIWKGIAHKLGSYLKEATAGGIAELEVKDLSYRYTADVMGDFLWGIESGALSHTGQAVPILAIGQKMLAQTLVAVDYYYTFQLAPFIKQFLDCRFYSEKTDNFFSKLGKHAIELRVKSSHLERADYLNHVLKLQEKKKLTHDDVMGHSITVLLNGFETSANAMYHTLFYLAKHPQVQDKLRAEILAHLEDDGFLTIENLNSLPYLDQCVHETLRLITPIPTFARICTEATTLEVEPGKRIPVEKNTILSIPSFSFHHDPAYFPQPYEYNPERFDNGAHLEMMKRGIFLPFGGGPRICMGMRLGLLEVKMGLTTILKQYRVMECARTMAEKKPDSNSFVFGLSGEIWLDFKELRLV